MKMFNFGFNIGKGWLFLRSLETYWKNLAILIGILNNVYVLMHFNTSLPNFKSFLNFFRLGIPYKGTVIGYRSHAFMMRFILQNAFNIAKYS